MQDLESVMSKVVGVALFALGAVILPLAFEAYIQAIINVAAYTGKLP